MTQTTPLVALGKVDHVERHDHRQAKCDQLQREPQMIVEIAGIDNNHKRVGAAVPLQFSKYEVAGDGLIQTIRRKAVSTG